VRLVTRNVHMVWYVELGGEVSLYKCKHFCCLDCLCSVRMARELASVSRSQLVSLTSVWMLQYRHNC